MGTPLTGLTPAATRVGLIKTTDNAALSATMKKVGDGSGNDSDLYLGTGKVGINEAVDITATSTELNYVAGVTSAIQTQLNAKEPLKGADDNYVTDAQLIVIGNTSGTNTGDNAVNSLYSGLAASKQDALISGTNIKTVNGTSLLGSGDIVIAGATWGSITGTLSGQTDLQSALDAKLALAGGTMTGSLLFTDNTYDIGASGATRPRTGYFGTSLISPKIIGGSGTTSTLTYQTTSGVGATGADHIFLVGNNGATEAMRILNAGTVKIGASTYEAVKLEVTADLRVSAAGDQYTYFKNNCLGGQVVQTFGDGNGNTQLLTINSSNVDVFRFNKSLSTTKFYLSALNTAPANASDTGTAGEIRFAADAIYLCTATNTWKKADISTW